MKRIVLDFLARWWWMVVLFIALIGFSAIGQPILFTPAAMVCLLLDAQRGLFRVVRPLPLTRREQALTWWFIGVLLLPLISLVPLVLGTGFYAWHHPPTATLSPWFYAAVTFWVGLGYAGLVFLVAMRMPARPPVGVLEWTEQIIIGGLWGFSMPGLMFILPNLPKTPAVILPWHWMLFAAVPVGVVLSYLAAPDMLRRRMFVVAAKTEPRPFPERVGSRSSGFTGIPLYLTTFVGRTLVMLILVALIQAIFLHSIMGVKDVASAVYHGLSIQVVMFAIMFGAITAESLGLRSLRSLPLSASQLVLLLLSIPCANGVFAALYTALWGGIGNPAVLAGTNFAAQALVLAGCGSLTLAVMMHVASGARIFLLMFFSIGCAFGLQFLGRQPAVLTAIGGCAIVLAFVLLLRGLRKSNAFYQPRRMFGMTPGQPMAVR